MSENINLRRFIEDAGLSFRENSRSYIFTCPRCGKSEKLMMFKGSGRFVCWRCREDSGFEGRAEIALAEMCGMTISQIRSRIYGDGPIQVDAKYFEVSLFDFYGDEDPPPTEAQVSEVRGKQWPIDCYPIDHKHAKTGREYLADRGIDLDLAMRYKLRYCPPEHRVLFPNYVGDKLLGWQGRYIFPHTWTDEETGEVRRVPKYLTTGPKDSLVMFQNRLVGSDIAVVVEGPVDAIKCDLLGGNVATMGKGVGPQQLKIIRGSGVKKVYLGLDLDAGTETMHLLEVFNDYYDIDTRERFEVFHLKPLPGYEDLGAMPVELMPELLANAELLRPGGLFLSLDA